MVLFNPLLVEGDKEVQTFPKGMSPKVIIIAQLQFKFTYYEVEVQYFSHYATGFSSWLYILKTLGSFQMLSKSLYFHHHLQTWHLDVLLLVNHDQRFYTEKEHA